MSEYITVYIQSNDGGPYLTLDTYSRNSAEFQTLKGCARYGDTVPATAALFHLAADTCDEEIEELKGVIQRHNEEIEFLRSLVFNPVDSEAFDEVMQRWWDARESIADVNEEIEDLKAARHAFEHYADMISEQEYVTNKARFWVSFEDDPNYADEVKEFMEK